MTAVNNDTERRMVLAHIAGVAKANEVFAIACNTAMNAYPDDRDAQLSYLAGLVQGLRRIAIATTKESQS